jgi:hypothetical protein
MREAKLRTIGRAKRGRHVIEGSWNGCVGAYESSWRGSMLMCWCAGVQGYNYSFIAHADEPVPRSASDW